jgi:hypothetical protein
MLSVVGTFVKVGCHSEAEHKSVASDSTDEGNVRCVTSVLNHQVHSLSASPNIIGVIESSRLTWAGHVLNNAR